MSDPIEYQYVGRRIANNGQRRYVFNEVGTDNNWTFKRPLINGLAIGSIVEVRISENGNVSLKPAEKPRYVRLGEAKADWIIEDRVAETELAAIARQKREAKDAKKFGDLTMDELRAEYMNTVGRIQGNGILASMIAYVTGVKVSRTQEG